MRICILIIMIFVLFILYFIIEKINYMAIFLPTKVDYNEFENLIRNNNAVIKETFKTHDNIELSGLLYNKYKTPSYNDNIILYSHGNAGWLGYLINGVQLNMLSKYGSVFIYDYRGYGISKGTPSENGVYLDIMAAWKYLVNEKKVSPKKIIVYGHSLGCAITTNLVKTLCEKKRELPIGLILEAPFISVRKIASKFIPNILCNFVLCNFNNEENIKIIKNKIPITICHSKNDEIIPYSHGVHLSEISGNKCVEIDGSHNSPLYNDSFENIIKKNFNE